MNPGSRYVKWIFMLTFIALSVLAESNAPSHGKENASSADSKHENIKSELPLEGKVQDVPSQTSDHKSDVSLKNSASAVNNPKDSSKPGIKESHEVAPVSNAANTTSNSTLLGPGPVGAGPLKLNPDAMLRGFYVFVGLGTIVILYIIIRTVRLKRKVTTVRKYGILANREDVEMTPLGAEDDDDDTTLFDVSNHSRP